MERRWFVSHLAGLLSMALGGGTLTGCATVGGVRYGRDLEPRAVVADWDAQVARLKAHGVPSRMRGQLRALGLPSTLVEDGFGSLLVAAGFRDLPRDLQQDPIIQQRLQEELPRMSSAVLWMTEYLEGLDDRVLRGVGRLLRRGDSPADQLRDEVVEAGVRQDLDPERVDQTLRLVDHVTWRLSHQDPVSVVDDTVHRVDKAVERVGGDRKAWSAAARRFERKPLGEYTDREVMTTTKQLGAWTLALGGLMAVGGLVTGYGSAIFGRNAVALFGVAVWTFGSMVFVMGLVMLTTVELARDVQRLR